MRPRTIARFVCVIAVCALQVACSRGLDHVHRMYNELPIPSGVELIANYEGYDQGSDCSDPQKLDTK